MNLYINNVLQKIEILPTNTPTLDETLETFSFALISNDNPLPLAPMQKVRVYIDEENNPTDFLDFYIVSDSVETYSLNPVRYKHSISCIQNTRKLSKHIVRNSVFSQPSYLRKKSYNATSQGAYQNAGAGGLSAWHNAYTSPSNPNLISKPLHLTNKEKIKKALFKLSFQFGYGQYSVGTDDLCVDAHTKNDILNLATDMTSITIANTLTLRYKNASNQTITETITPATFGASDFDLNGEYDFPRVKQLADQGCNDFELLFDSRLFLDGTYTTDNIRVLFWFAQLQIVANIYYHNCYDILNLLIERQRKLDTLNTNTAPLFSLPDSGELYDLLKSTIAPNFTFTQLTMYECVAEVFRLFDAIFTLDENDVLGIEYFNNLENTKITPKITGRTLALGEDKYTNGLVAHYQDARVEEQFPKGDKFANLRSAEFGIPEAQDHHFIVPHNIQNIVKLEILIEGLDVKFSSGADSGFHVTTSLALDITDFVFEESIWSTLDTGAMQDSDYDSYLVKQANSVYFAQGDNKIKLAATFKSSWGLVHYTLTEIVEMAILKLAGVYTAVVSDHPKDVFYPNPNIYDGEWDKIKMRATYIATVDGKMETHSLTNKYDGETLVDQNNGAVDLNKMGLNMLGLSLKLGNPTLNATHKITTWANRVRTGQLYEYQGKLWVANVVSYSFLKGGDAVIGKISFVQNFNALSLRTQLLREKRMSNISKELTQKSEEVITDFVYFTTEYPQDVTGETIHFNESALRSGILLLNPAFHLGDVVSYKLQSGLSGMVAIYIPTVAYGAGNTLNFEMTFEHPISAGNRTTKSTAWYGSNKYFTDYVPYTDKNGFLDEINIRAPYSVAYTDEFPNVGVYAYDDANAYSFFDIRSLKIYKQPNEIFALNYQLAFLPMPGRENIDFLNAEFCNNHPFIKGIKDSGSLARYIVIFDRENSVLDTKAIDYLEKQQAFASIIVNSDDIMIMTFSFSQLDADNYANMKSWAMVDKDDNILLASNTKTTSDSNTIVYVFTKLKRLN